MRPKRRSRIWSHTAFAQRTAPIRCTSTTRRKSARSILAKLRSRRMPALLTNMSTPPQASVAEWTIAATCSSSVTDAGGSEEHTSELQSLMRISYAVFCLKKNNHNYEQQRNDERTLLPHTPHVGLIE